MIYGYQKASGNVEWAKHHLPLLQKYADYLVTHGRYPAAQRYSVDSIGPQANQTALAMSAAISLKAFGALSGMNDYTKLGDNYATTVLELGTDPLRTHLLTQDNDPASSWLLAYPLAFDKLLDLQTFSQSIYQMQSNWYQYHMNTYGIQLTSEVKYTLLEFEFWVAATSSSGIQHLIVDSVHDFLTKGLNSIPGPTQWWVSGKDQGAWTNQSSAKSIIGSSFFIAAVNGGSSGQSQVPFALCAVVLALQVTFMFCM